MITGWGRAALCWGGCGVLSSYGAAPEDPFLIVLCARPFKQPHGVSDSLFSLSFSLQVSV